MKAWKTVVYIWMGRTSEGFVIDRDFRVESSRMGRIPGRWRWGREEIPVEGRACGV